MPVADSSFLSHLDQLMEKSEKENRVTIFNWKEALKSKTVIAFGLGKFYKDTWERLDKLVKISYLSDNNREYYGKIINGRKVISPDEIRSMKDGMVGSLSPVFVIIVTGVEAYLSIKKQFDDMGIPSIHISELHFHYYDKGMSFKWLRDDMGKIQKALLCLEDEESRSVFKNILIGLVYPPIGLPFKGLYSSGEYFQTGVWKCGADEIFCDCGSFNGDTLMDFVDCCQGSFREAHCFELDKRNFVCLQENVHMLSPDLQNKIHLYNYGVYKEHVWGTCGFQGDSDGCEIIHSGQGESCELVKLDDMVEKCSILKMDIEGAEIDALKGAEQLIRYSKPKLAICVYHRPEDIYEVPLEVKDMCPKYKVYLRHHSYNFLDTVMYAYV